MVYAVPMTGISHFSPVLRKGKNLLRLVIVALASTVLWSAGIRLLCLALQGCPPCGVGSASVITS